MSKNETIKVNSKDIFSVYQENVDKMFNGVKQSVPQYHQSITNVQQEYLQAFENMVDSSIAIQKEFVIKAGIASDVPSTTLKVIDDTTEEFVKASSIQNQIDEQAFRDYYMMKVQNPYNISAPRQIRLGLKFDF